MSEQGTTKDQVLKCCPFCGGAARWCRDDEHECHLVVCTDCKISIDFQENPDTETVQELRDIMASKWNRRACGDQKSGSDEDQSSLGVQAPVASGSLPNTLAEPLPSKERDTPQTDAAVYYPFDPPSAAVVSADFARKLERELDEAHEEIEYFETGCVRKDEEIANLRRDNVRWENAHKILLAENARLRLELNDSITNHNLKDIEIERLRRPAHEREGPHCSTCACGLTPEPAADVESQEFYELMQSYRHMPAGNQAAVCMAFEAVKKFVRGAAQPPGDGHAG